MTDSHVQFLFHPPSTALTSRFIPFTPQEYRQMPMIAITPTRGGAVLQSPYIPFQKQGYGKYRRY
jgi:hypothetical protein